MCMFIRGFQDYLVSYIRASGFINTNIIKSYIRRVLAREYGTYNFVKYFRGSVVPRARILNAKSSKKGREHCYRKLEKVEGSKKDFIFQNQKTERI